MHLEESKLTHFQGFEYYSTAREAKLLLKNKTCLIIHRSESDGIPLNLALVSPPILFAPILVV